MKNISLLLNAVLIIAVGVLFYLHFSSKKEIAEVKNNQKADSVPQLSFSIPKNLNGARVLYVNIDTISTRYEAFADLSSEAGNNLDYLTRQYQSKGLELQQRYDALQQKVQMGTINADDAAKEEAAINAGTDDLKKMETNITVLQNKAMEKNARINEEVTKYFKEYSKQKGIDFILGTGAGSNVLYANDSLNVTQEVLNALNENYRKNKPAKK